MHYVCPLIQVFDMIESAAFYRGALGFELVQASDPVDTAEGQFSHWMWLRRGEVNLMLNTAYDSDERPPERDAARQAAHGDTCLYIGCDDADALHADLAARGVDGTLRTAPYGLRELSLSDPDGYQLCFQSPG